MPAIRSLRQSLRTVQDNASEMSHSALTRLNAGRSSLIQSVRRSEGNDSDSSSDHLINILLGVLGVAFAGLLIVSVLFLIRRRRVKQAQREQPILPSYSEVKQGHPNHRGLKIETSHNGRSSVVIITHDNKPMLQNPNSPPHSPDNVPEIHITFPDEHDEHGQRRSGRVLVVRVGDNAAVGLEPMQEEQLPAYEKEAKGQFYSIDIDAIGGLKEKDHSYFDDK